MKKKSAEVLKEEVEQVREEIIEKKSNKELAENSYNKDQLLSSGSTLLNLACSDTIEGAYLLGSIVHTIGDNHSGKSLLGLSMVAEACIDKRFNNYTLDYGEYEAAMNFNKENLFGKNINRVTFSPSEEDRLKGPATIQDWHSHLMNLPTPFIHVTDSLDVLLDRTVMEEDRPEKGGWKTGKAIVLSEFFPKIAGRIKATNSLMNVISQTRDNIGVTFGEKKTHSGGNAIKFYRTHAIWIAIASKIMKKVRGKDREIGANIVAKIKKNKLTGKVRRISFPVFYEYGVDDIRSMIEWMVEEKFWGREKGEKSKIFTEGDFIDGGVDKIIEQVEKDNQENKLKNIVFECWKELEKEILSGRKKKYE